MTNEEASDVLKKNYPDSCFQLLRAAVDVALEALKKEKGNWIVTDVYNNQIWHCNCSTCGKDLQYFISGTEDWWINTLPNFCPNCGAKMGK